MFCTRCLDHFYHERYLNQHVSKCPNKVIKENLLDKLKITGGFSKEIRRKRIRTYILHAKKLEAELLMELDEENDDEEDQEVEDSEDQDEDDSCSLHDYNENDDFA